jgi:hypothetical protein
MDDKVYQCNADEENVRVVRLNQGVRAIRPSRSFSAVPVKEYGRDWAEGERVRAARRLPTVTVAGLELPVADPGVVAARRAKLAASGAKVRGL